VKNPRKDLEECFGRDFEPDARKALAELRRLIREAGDSAVVLVEGRRAVPELDHARLVAVGEWLAREFPAALFRSGNAEGADSLFATGVGKVDPCRLQLVLPNPTMGRSRLIAGAAVYALDGASAETKRLLT